VAAVDQELLQVQFAAFGQGVVDLAVVLIDQSVFLDLIPGFVAPWPPGKPAWLIAEKNTTRLQIQHKKQC